MKKPKNLGIAFLLIAIISIVSLFYNHSQSTAEFGSEQDINFADTAWVLTASCLVMLMTPGLSFFYGGMVGRKSIISTMLQSIICLGVIAIIWIVFGFSLAFGDPSISVTIDGTRYGLLGNFSQYAFFDNVDVLPHKIIASSIPFVLFAVFQMKFAIITPALITGGFAERIRFTSYLLFICLFSIVIYSPLCHSVWHPQGFLSAYVGIKDFAGGTVVHMSAGFAALAGAIVIGKRKKTTHQASNIPFIILGTGLLWFGWFGFNAGSSLAANGLAAKAFATTFAASACAMMTWVFFDQINGRKISAVGTCIGAVVGLVAITPAAGFVSVTESLFIGFISAIVSNILVNWEKLKKIDDSLDVFACHGIGGLMGMILTAIFAEGEDVSLLHGGWSIFMHHMLAIIGVCIFTFAGSFILLKITDKIIPLRISEKSEEEGLDISQHDEVF